MDNIYNVREHSFNTRYSMNDPYSAWCDFMHNRITVNKIEYDSRIQHASKALAGIVRKTRIVIQAVANEFSYRSVLPPEVKVYVPMDNGYPQLVNINVCIVKDFSDPHRGHNTIDIVLVYQEMRPDTVFSVENILKPLLLQNCSPYLNYKVSDFYNNMWRKQILNLNSKNNMAAIIPHEYKGNNLTRFEDARSRNAYQHAFEPFTLIEPEFVDTTSKLSKKKAIINSLNRPKKVQINVNSKKSNLWKKM